MYRLLNVERLGLHGAFLLQCRLHLEIPLPDCKDRRIMMSSIRNEVMIPPIMGAAMRFITSVDGLVVGKVQVEQHEDGRLSVHSE
jgi:hypothetical protein